MKTKTNTVRDVVLDAHPANKMVTAQNPSEQTIRLVSYNEEWVAFVTNQSKQKRMPDGFDLCPRVWNLPTR